MKVLRENWLAWLTCVVMTFACSGCFIANAKKRDRERQRPDTNLPPMTVTTNLFNPTRLPDIF